MHFYHWAEALLNMLWHFHILLFVKYVCVCLSGRSTLQTGDNLWYFMYPPKYKYRNSKRISRTTLEGYWKPTGNARKIIDPDTGVEIGSKKTLVFFKGQCNDKIKNKTCWVMHEYELKAAPTITVSDQVSDHSQATIYASLILYIY